MGAFVVTGVGEQIVVGVAAGKVAEFGAKLMGKGWKKLKGNVFQSRAGKEIRIVESSAPSRSTSRPITGKDKLKYDLGWDAIFKKGQAHVPSGSMKGKAYGHTWSKHGSHNTHELLMEAQKSKRAVGQWLDDAAAEEFIASKLPELKQGAQTFDLPAGLGRQINPDGTWSPANKVRLVPSRTGVSTAWPFAE